MAFGVGFGIMGSGLILTTVSFESGFLPKRHGVVRVPANSAAAQRGYANPGEGSDVYEKIKPRHEMARTSVTIGGVLAAIGLISLLPQLLRERDWAMLGCLPLIGGIAGLLVGLLLGIIPNPTVYWSLLGLISVIALLVPSLNAANDA